MHSNSSVHELLVSKELPFIKFRCCYLLYVTILCWDIHIYFCCSNASFRMETRFKRQQTTSAVQSVPVHVYPRLCRGLVIFIEYSVAFPRIVLYFWLYCIPLFPFIPMVAAFAPACSVFSYSFATAPNWMFTTFGSQGGGCTLRPFASVYQSVEACF